MKRKININTLIVYRYNTNEGIKCSNFNNNNEDIRNIDNQSNNGSNTETEFIKKSSTVNNHLLKKKLRSMVIKIVKRVKNELKIKIYLT